MPPLPPGGPRRHNTALAVPDPLYQALRLEAGRRGVLVMDLGAELLATGLFRAVPGRPIKAKKDKDK